MFPRDKYGKEFKTGDLFTEGFIGEEIWNKQGKIINPPIGIFTGEAVDEDKRIRSGWYVKNYMLGKVEYENKEWDIYITTWDGEFEGD